MKHILKKLSFKNFQIDIDSKAAQREIDLLKEALYANEVLILIDHKIPKEIIDNAYEQSKIFHSLDDDDPRKQSAHYRNAHFGRGWSPCGQEPAYLANTKATCSAFDLCYEITEIDHEHENYGPNLWPPKMPEFRKHVYNYYLTFTALEQTFARALEHALDLEKDYITSKMTERSPSTMRLIYYPCIEDGPEANLYGISAHTDYEVFTLLTQTNLGLEIQNQKGEWLGVDVGPYEVVVNIGDMIERMTNGKIKASNHRVVPVQWIRYSIARFCAIDGDHIVKPLSQFVDPDIGPLYEPITQQDNIKNGLAQATANSEAMKQQAVN